MYRQVMTSVFQEHLNIIPLDIINLLGPKLFIIKQLIAYLKFLDHCIMHILMGNVFHHVVTCYSAGVFGSPVCKKNKNKKIFLALLI